MNFNRYLLRASAFLCSLSVGVLAVGCGYVSESAYLKHIRTVRVPPVQNQTILFELEDELTAALRTRFQSRWTDGDDAILLVTAHNYDIRPIGYDINNFPEKYRMLVVLDYEFRDNVKAKLVDAKRDYEYHHDFYVVSGRGEPPEDEAAARKRLLSDLVDELYYNLAEQW